MRSSEVVVEWNVDMCMCMCMCAVGAVGAMGAVRWVRWVVCVEWVECKHVCKSPNQSMQISNVLSKRIVQRWKTKQGN